MDIDTALSIAWDPFATRWEQTEVGHILAGEVARLRAELARTRRTLGGPPPEVDRAWGNRDLRGGAHRDYEGRL